MYLATAGAAWANGQEFLALSFALEDSFEKDRN